MGRDRDVRNAAQELLIATGAFDQVYVLGLPEDYGSGASNLLLAVIEPLSTNESDLWDAAPAGGLVMHSVTTVTLIARNDDPQLRDEQVELLMGTAANALNGQSLAGITLPQMTKFSGWRFEKPTPPERRITATFIYSYIVEGWGGFDTTP